MAIGLQRAGYLGMFLAWVGFTLPSVLLMVAFALGVAQLGDISEAGWLLGLKAAAVTVVAQAVYGMTKNLVTGKIHAAIAVAALVLVLLVPHPLIQVGAIVLGIVAGLAFLRVKKEADDQPQAESGSRTFGIVCLVLFFALLFVLPLVARLIGTTGADIFDTFYRAGALVFGGGHVVLPLLETVTVGPGLYHKSLEIQRQNVRNWDAAVADWAAREGVAGTPAAFKPFAESLWLDLHEDPDAPASGGSFGYRLGRNTLVQLLRSQREVGISHVMVNFRSSKRSAEEQIDELIEYVIPALED